MIIKYYCNGWNYIDNIENVKWLNFDFAEMFKTKNGDGHKIDIIGATGNKKILSAKVKVLGEDTWIEEDVYTSFYNIMYQQVHDKLMERGEQQIIIINIEVTHIDLVNMVELSNGEEVKLDRSRYPDYARVICYNKQDTRKAICFIGTAYLLNNQGQTIEKIG